jgi:hypothetical protein
MLAKLYKADRMSFRGINRYYQMEHLLGWFDLGSRTLKGAAVKLSQHICLIF